MTKATIATTALFLFCMTSDLAAQPGGIEVKTKFFTQTDVVNSGEITRGALIVDLQDGFHVNSNEPLEKFLIPTSLDFIPTKDIHVLGLAYPEAIHLVTGGSETPLAVFEQEFAIGIEMDIGADIKLGRNTLFGQLNYQACDDKLCYRPAELPIQLVLDIVGPDGPSERVNERLFSEIDFNKLTPAGVISKPLDLDFQGVVLEERNVISSLDGFDLVGTTGGYLSESDFISFIDDAENGRVRNSWFEGRGLFAIVAIVMLGGLALNLTPCVLPLIPVNLSIIGAGAKAGSRVQGFVLGATYGLAMALVYGLLGLVVILTAGTFGTLNASAWFNFSIAVLFVLLALAMLDVIAIDFSGLQTKVQLGGQSSKLAVAFAMGSVAALLAGACVAPVVIQVVVFSGDLYAKGQLVALGLPFLLGLGMALPWPFAGAGLALLPKPGAWMLRVKQVFAVLILVLSGYYGYLGYEIVSSRWVDSNAVAESVQEKIEEGWIPNLSMGLEKAKYENKNLLVDIWATWCKNCLVMDKTTFRDEDVMRRLEDYVKVKFQAEDPELSPAKEFMQRVGGVGLPFYVILKPKS